MFRSNVSRANLVAGSTFSAVLVTNWFLCRFRYVEDQHSFYLVREKMMDYIENRKKIDDNQVETKAKEEKM